MHRNTPPRWQVLCTAIMLVLSGGGCAFGVLVGVEYYDRAVVNPTFSGGPLWTGYVDTTANSLTIQTWTELPLHGSEYWIPGQLPLVWPARNAQGGIFDVPDTFNGHIDDSFAFISNQTLRQMSWLEPVFQVQTPGGPPVLVNTIPIQFTLSTIEIRPGWGGWAFGPLNATPAQFTFLTKNPFQGPGQVPYDERTMPMLPVEANGSPIASTNAEVSISLGSTASVPEVGSWALLAAVAAAASASRWVRRLVAQRA